MSKASRISKMKMAKKLTEKIDHSSKLRTNIGAGMASAAPPLGSQLGQVRVLFIGFICIGRRKGNECCVVAMNILFTI